jgi:hypothetical protein
VKVESLPPGYFDFGGRLTTYIHICAFCSSSAGQFLFFVFFLYLQIIPCYVVVFVFVEMVNMLKKLVQAERRVTQGRNSTEN